MTIYNCRELWADYALRKLRESEKAAAESGVSDRRIYGPTKRLVPSRWSNASPILTTTSHSFNGAGAGSVSSRGDNLHPHISNALGLSTTSATFTPPAAITSTTPTGLPINSAL